MARFLRPGWFEVETYAMQPEGVREVYRIAVQVAHVHLVFPHTGTETAIYTPRLNIHALATYAEVLAAMGLAAPSAEVLT
jgi:hypothetical protein